VPQLYREDSFGFITRYDWWVDCRPTGNVHRRDVVGQASEPADHTGEPGLRRTIGFVHVTAGRTGAARIARVHQIYRHTRTVGFVGHEGAQLKERPAMQDCPLRATNRNPRTDALEIFQGNGSICVFRLGNQLLADAVIGVPGKTVLFARQSFEFAFGRARAFGLQFGPQPASAEPHVIDVAPRVDLPIAVHRDIHHAQVDPQGAFHFHGRGLLHFASGGEEEQTLMPSQVAFPCRLQYFHRRSPQIKGIRSLPCTVQIDTV
jgi:hypothetical protein